MPFKVLLDSNFLMLFPIFHGDLFEELDKVVNRKTEKIVIIPVYEELRRISLEGDTRSKKQAEMVLKFIEKGKFRFVNVELKPLEMVDELIARTAETWKCFVATNDRELRKRLTKLGVAIVYLRQRNRLEARGKL